MPQKFDSFTVSNDPKQNMVIFFSIKLVLQQLKPRETNTTYRISSPISRAIFSVFNPKFWEIFHEERGSACSRGF